MSYGFEPDPGACSPVWATVEGVERATDDPADHSPERSRDPRRLLGVPGARGSARGSSSRWPRTRGRGQRRGADPSSGGLGPQRLGYGQRDDVWSPSVARSFHTARIGASATWSPRRSRRTAQRRRRRRQAKSIPTSRNLPSSLDASDPDGFSFPTSAPALRFVACGVADWSSGGHLVAGRRRLRRASRASPPDPEDPCGYPAITATCRGGRRSSRLQVLSGP